MSKAEVERVLKATRESAASYLRDGKKFDIPGTCSLTPDVKKSLGVDCKEIREIVVKANPLGALVDLVRQGVNMSDYQVKKENRKGIKKASMEYLR